MSGANPRADNVAFGPKRGYLFEKKKRRDIMLVVGQRLIGDERINDIKVKVTFVGNYWDK